MKGKSWILNVLYIFLTIIIVFLIDSHYEYKQIKIKMIEIKSKDVPKEFDGK